MSAAAQSLDKPLSGAKLYLCAIMLASANFIAVLDMTVANVSVPNIAGSLGVASSQATWVITSYAVAEAIIVPLTGWIAARFGPVKVFTIAMMLFGMFSNLCAFSTSLGMLIFGRVMQGLAGGLLMPLSQTLLLRIFPKEKANAAMALWAMTTLSAPVLGPILGGWLCENYGWPLIFLINVPLALVCAPMARRMLKRYEEAARKKPMDIGGLILLVVFVGALQLMVDLGKEHAWFSSPMIVALGLVALAGFVLFVIWELTEKNPIVDLRVFRHRGFTASVVTLTFAFGLKDDEPAPFAWKVILTVAGSTVTWLAVTFLTAPESRETLAAFYRRVRPNAALWGPIAREATDVVPVRDGLYNLLDWAAGCVFVYMTLFGVGKLVFGDTVTGAAFLGIGAAAAAVIYWDLNRRGWKTVME